jgi:hypothetical protein
MQEQQPQEQSATDTPLEIQDVDVGVVSDLIKEQDNG